MNPNELSKEVLFQLVISYKKKIEELESSVKPIPEDELWKIFKQHTNGLDYARAIEEYHGIK
jgi:hypothetical protein